jgi:hypothetical protein
MRIVAVALGSFIIGAFCMSLLGNRASTGLQPVVLAQSDEVIGIHRFGATPIVPTVLLQSLSGIGFGTGMSMELDGFDCQNCKLENGARIKYSGGLYKFENLERRGVIALDLQGPALNTLGLLSQFGLIGCPTTNPQPEPENPGKAIKTASLKTQKIAHLVSVVQAPQ